MNRIDKIRYAISKGYTCDPSTGFILGANNKPIGRKDKYGYMYISIYTGKNTKNFNIKAHQFIWYWVNNEIVPCIDHINQVKDDNRIENLRSVTDQQNKFNGKKGKGCRARLNKWISYISIKGKSIHLGCFDNEQDAKDAYEKAKRIYHII
jgi:hypothetical protein